MKMKIAVHLGNLSVNGVSSRLSSWKTQNMKSVKTSEKREWPKHQIAEDKKFESHPRIVKDFLSSKTLEIKDKSIAKEIFSPL